jgi:hypothetical protein
VKTGTHLYSWVKRSKYEVGLGVLLAAQLILVPIYTPGLRDCKCELGLGVLLASQWVKRSKYEVIKVRVFFGYTLKMFWRDLNLRNSGQ